MEAERPVAHPSSLGMKDAEHLSRQRLSRGAGMTAVLFASAFPAKNSFAPDRWMLLFPALVLGIGFEYLKMQYRGKDYIVVQGIEPDSWKWTVDLDEHTSRSGEAKTR